MIFALQTVISHKVNSQSLIYPSQIPSQELSNIPQSQHINIRLIPQSSTSNSSIIYAAVPSLQLQVIPETCTLYVYLDRNMKSFSLFLSVAFAKW